MVLLLTALLGCSEKVELTDGDLFQVSNLKSRMISDTFRIAYIDNSLNFFEDYNALKSNVIVFVNTEQIKDYPYVQTVGSTKDREKNFSKKYSLEDVAFTKNMYDNNPIFRDYAIHICRTFDVNDWWNFRGAVDVMNKEYENLGNSPIDLLFQLSLLQDTAVEKSKVYQRLSLVGKMIRDTGVADAFTREQKSSEAFIKKFNYFLERRNLPLIQ
ncbi:MAG: hypothetical protein AAF990_07885 [Bacteroidota bacterium]